MTPTQAVPEGRAYIEGRSGARAKRLLELAEELGFTPAVEHIRTTSFGYMVPSEVAQALDGAPTEPLIQTQTEDAAALSVHGADARIPDGTEQVDEQGDGEQESTETDSELVDGEPQKTEGEAGGDDATSKEELPPPPRAGAGSSAKAWTEWAVAAHNYDPAEGLTRDQIMDRFAPKATE